MLGLLGLWLAALILPWSSRDGFNPDLMVLAHDLDENLPKSFYAALSDNTILVYISRSVFDHVSPMVLMNGLQNVSATIFCFTLLKVVRPTFAFAIVAFCFFSILLNQFRLELGIAICLVGVRLPFNKRLGRIVFLAASIVGHVFVSIWYACYMITDYWAGGSLWRRATMLFLVVILGTYCAVKFEVESLGRYADYLVFVGPSYTFVLSAICLGVLWPTLGSFYRLLLVGSVIAAALVCNMPALSGRIGEMSFITTLVMSGQQDAEKGRRVKHCFPNSWREYAVLGIGLVFFAYRSSRWFVFGLVPLPLGI